MKLNKILAFITLVICSPNLLAIAADASPKSLFDGKSLNGWSGNEKLWRVEDGAITGTIAAGTSLRQNEFLFWEGEVGDFELSLEFKIEGVSSANSGIQFRSQRQGARGAAGYQADLDQGAQAHSETHTYNEVFLLTLLGMTARARRRRLQPGHITEATAPAVLPDFIVTAVDLP